MLPELSRRQIIIWAAVGAAIFLSGAWYLYRDWKQGGERLTFTASTTISASAAATTPESLWVHVAGAVVSPGLYELHDGERVADAISRAGGAAPEADLSRVNLAARVADGQQVLVPARGQALPAGSGGERGVPAGPVSLNSASAEELDALDGIGPKTARKIIEYRDANGGFKTVEELMEVPGIGPAKFEQLRGQVTL